MAYQEGYNAGWEFHLGSGEYQENPYRCGTDEESQEYYDWERGFNDAAEDS